jgi:hypothetical protein
MAARKSNALKDCYFFLDGKCTKGENCEFRHCSEALTTSVVCAKWPRCENLTCPHRHLPIKPTPSTIIGGQRTKTVSTFWDLQNVAIPRGQKAFDIVKRLRQRFIVDKGLSEANFTVYCDTQSVPKEHLVGLDNANVCIKYVPSLKQGSADSQIKMDLETFKKQHSSPATIVLISGDIDFVKYLNVLRYTDKHTVIVIHNDQARSELMDTAEFSYPWSDFTMAPADKRLLKSNGRVITGRKTQTNLNPTQDPSEETLNCPLCTTIFQNMESLEEHQINQKHW